MVLAATNHPWDIDEAFRRRFEKRVYIGLPNGKYKTLLDFYTYVLNPYSLPDETRSALINLCLKGVSMSTTLDTNIIAEELKGYTGSDISNVCRLVNFK